MGHGFALVLVKKGNGVDEGEIFFMIAPRSGAAAGEGEFTGIRVGDAHGRDEALGVLHDSQDVFAALVLQDAFDGAGLAL